MEFATPWYLLFLLLVPAFALLHLVRRKGREVSLVFPSGTPLQGLPQGWKVRARNLPFIMMIVAVAFLSIAAARPQSGRSHEIIKTEGIDIMLVLDISGSMMAEDFKPNNRLQVAKNVIGDFISMRKGDRIGLVLFAGKAFTQCPLTVDYDILNAFLERTDIGMIEDGTAIGTAIATATNRLRDSEADSRIIILLTDGVNNVHEVEPLTAAQLALAVGVKVYTVGVGTKGYALMPLRTPFGGTIKRRVKVQIDEQTLREIADTTGGHYFRATDPQSLQQIYEKINRLEKSTVEIEHFTEYSEHFTPYAIAGLLFLAVGLMLESTILRKVG